MEGAPQDEPKDASQEDATTAGESQCDGAASDKAGVPPKTSRWQAARRVLFILRVTNTGRGWRRRAHHFMYTKSGVARIQIENGYGRQDFIEHVMGCQALMSISFNIMKPLFMQGMDHMTASVQALVVEAISRVKVACAQVAWNTVVEPFKLEAEKMQQRCRSVQERFEKMRREHLKEVSNLRSEKRPRSDPQSDIKFFYEPLNTLMPHELAYATDVITEKLKMIFEVNPNAIKSADVGQLAKIKDLAVTKSTEELREALSKKERQIVELNEDRRRLQRELAQATPRGGRNADGRAGIAVLASLEVKMEKVQEEQRATLEKLAEETHRLQEVTRERDQLLLKHGHMREAYNSILEELDGSRKECSAREEQLREAQDMCRLHSEQLARAADGNKDLSETCARMRSSMARMDRRRTETANKILPLSDCEGADKDDSTSPPQLLEDEALAQDVETPPLPCLPKEPSEASSSRSPRRTPRMTTLKANHSALPQSPQPTSPSSPPPRSTRARLMKGLSPRTPSDMALDGDLQGQSRPASSNKASDGSPQRRAQKVMKGRKPQESARQPSQDSDVLEALPLSRGDSFTGGDEFHTARELTPWREKLLAASHCKGMWKTFWSQASHEGTDSLTAEEFAGMVRSDANIPERDLPDPAIHDVFKAADVKKAGCLSYAQFATWLGLSALQAEAEAIDLQDGLAKGKPMTSEGVDARLWKLSQEQQGRQSSQDGDVWEALPSPQGSRCTSCEEASPLTRSDRSIRFEEASPLTRSDSSTRFEEASASPRCDSVTDSEGHSRPSNPGSPCGTRRRLTLTARHLAVPECPQPKSPSLPPCRSASGKLTPLRVKLLHASTCPGVWFGFWSRTACRGTNRLTEEEFRGMVRNAAKISEWDMPDHEIQEVFKAIDVENAECLSYKQFHRWMHFSDSELKAILRQANHIGLQDGLASGKPKGHHGLPRNHSQERQGRLQSAVRKMIDANREASPSPREASASPRGGRFPGGEKSCTARLLTPWRVKLRAASPCRGVWFKFWSLADHEGTDRLTAEEFRGMIRREAKISEWDMPDHVIQDVFKAIDVGNAECLSYDQFAQWLHLSASELKASLSRANHIGLQDGLARGKPKGPHELPWDHSQEQQGRLRSVVRKLMDANREASHSPRGGRSTGGEEFQTALELSPWRGKLLAASHCKGMWKKFWSQADHEGTDSLTAEEFARMLRNDAKIPECDLPEAAVLEVFQAADVEQTGCLSYAQFACWLDLFASEVEEGLAKGEPMTSEGVSAQIWKPSWEGQGGQPPQDGDVGEESIGVGIKDLGSPPFVVVNAAN